MSRTYRKSEESFDSYWHDNLDWYLNYISSTEARERAKWKYNPQRGYQHWTLPKEFRNSVNRSRRARDRQEIYREINIIEYEGLYDPWNCKTANQWGYW